MKNPIVLYIFLGMSLQACAGYNYIQPPPRIILYLPQIVRYPADTAFAILEPQTQYLHGSRSVADDYEEPDPLLGKIVFIGPNNPFEYEAVVRMDGKCIGTLSDGGYLPVRLPSFGKHIVAAKIYWVRHGGGRNRRVLVDTYQDDFYVSPIYPTRHDGEYWWSKEIHLSFFHFFNY